MIEALHRMSSAEGRIGTAFKSHLIIPGNSAVVGFRGQDHVEFSLISSSSIILGVESQGQRVFITQVDFLPVPVDPHPRTP